ncbi:MAG: hypothetical protein WED10_14915 [Brumimicrobium sp.]
MNYKEVELIKGGIKLFGDKGFDDFNAKELEQLSDVRKGSFFEFFETPEKFAKDCYIVIVKELLESNREFISNLEDGLSYRELSRKVWFNTIAWWLNNSYSLKFYQQFRCSKYYFEDRSFIVEQSKEYYDFIDYGMKGNELKAMPYDFLYELVVVQILNTVCFIKENDRYMGDKEFLKVSFDALWDSIRLIEIAD